ncbi:MAG: Mur ligase family protein [Syntrophobacter sp.]
MKSNGIEKIYMVGIGGIAMGTLATMLKESGYEVGGSDQNLYPPMSTHLASLNIPLYQGFAPENPLSFGPDICIIGNVVRRENPEAVSILSRDLPYLSMPQAIENFFLGRQKGLVVTGTHGKSTTSSLLAWVLEQGGMDPGAFIGAFLKDWQRSFRLGDGNYMVIEGDEYDTAFFDKGPKFLHYQPQIGIVTSIEYDHADIFPNFEAILTAFRNFARLVPERGHLILNADDPNCAALARECPGHVLTYGYSHRADWRIKSVEYGSGLVSFTLRTPGAFREETFQSRLSGRHNVWNITAVVAAATLAGMPIERIREAVWSFGGVTRRQDIIAETNGIIVMDDFAHHPTAVNETLSGLRHFYPERRLIAAFEPRTNSSRRNVFQEHYSRAFDSADIICIKQPQGMEAIPENERLNTELLVHSIHMREKEAHYFTDADSLTGFLLGIARPGDLIVCMSNGSFDGLPQRLADGLREI